MFQGEKGAFFFVVKRFLCLEMVMRSFDDKKIILFFYLMFYFFSKVAELNRAFQRALSPRRLACLGTASVPLKCRFPWGFAEPRQAGHWVASRALSVSQHVSCGSGGVAVWWCGAGTCLCWRRVVMHAA